MLVLTPRTRLGRPEFFFLGVEPSEFRVKQRKYRELREFRAYRDLFAAEKSFEGLGFCREFPKMWNRVFYPASRERIRDNRESIWRIWEVGFSRICGDYVAK
jgi:hypothetical protein